MNACMAHCSALLSIFFNFVCQAARLDAELAAGMPTAMSNAATEAFSGIQQVHVSKVPIVPHNPLATRTRSGGDESASTREALDAQCGPSGSGFGTSARGPGYDTERDQAELEAVIGMYPLASEQARLVLDPEVSVEPFGSFKTSSSEKGLVVLECC